MLERWIKFFGLIVLVLGLWAADGTYMRVEARDQLPLRSITITMNAGIYHRVAYQFRRFADQYQFAIRFSQTGPDPEAILVEMWREDVKVKGFNITAYTEPDAVNRRYDISFYQTCDLPVDPVMLDEMVKVLNNWVGQVEGVIATKIEQREPVTQAP